MKIYQVTDPEFKEYGRVLKDCDVSELAEILKKETPIPEGTDYVADDPAVSDTTAAKRLEQSLFGGLPVQFGWCNGHNTKLNCLEYHRTSEFNLGTEDFILLLAKQSEIQENRLDTSCVKAFYVPKHLLIEVYATTLHYAPCHVDPKKGFQVLVALPEGTNQEIQRGEKTNPEDELLWANNKWLLAHPDSSEAKNGAWIGLSGENIDFEMK